MKRWLAFLFVCGAWLWPTLAQAQAAPVSIDPPALQLNGNVDGGALTGSFVITTSRAISNVLLSATDLQDFTRDRRMRPPLSASTVSFSPSAQFVTLPANTLTPLVIQVTAPAIAGNYRGFVTLRWAGPSPGKVLVPLLVNARKEPALAIQDPAQIAIKAVQGETITRRVVLHETTNGSTLTNLQGLAEDLVDTNGKTLLAATKIKIDLPGQQIAGGRFLTATLNIDLQGVAAGGYTGNLLFFAESGSSVPLPVNISVRHHWFWPLLVLILGVGLGMILTGYQTRGRPRDELIVRLAAVRQAMHDDQVLTTLFGPGLDPTLEDAEAALRRANWDAARTSIEKAELYVQRWRAGRSGWVTQFNYLKDKLAPRMIGEANTMRKLRQQVETIKGEIADNESPAKLREKLFAVEMMLVDFETVQSQINQLGNLRVQAAADPATKETWRKQELAFQNQLQTLLPDSAEWTALKHDIEALRQTISAALPIPQGTNGAPAAAGQARGLAQDQTWPTPAGLLLPEAEAISYTDGVAATYRLQNFGWVTYALGGLLLAGAGFSALYLANPIFGAAPVTDYLTLLAWGLGAQTTFTSIADLLSKWGIPLNR